MKFEIDKVILRMVRFTLKESFSASFGTITSRDDVVVEVCGQGISGFGESAVLPFPFYNHETPQTAYHILKDFAVPMFFKDRPLTPKDAGATLKKIVGNNIGKSGLEMAYWDWAARAAGKPLYAFLGGKRTEIPVGISIGIQKETPALLAKVGKAIEDNYKKIKIKIAPEHDLNLIEAIFHEFPNVPLMVDANSAYKLEDAALFKAMDQFKLMMIEQPLREGDIYEHSILQRELKNPICLDESIENLEDAKAAIALGSCKIINIKPGRVSGLAESIAIHDLGAQNGVGVWCGGMLETGIGRAANMAIATLGNYIYPGDISSPTEYLTEDLIEPEIKITTQGTLKLTDKPGIGFEVNRERLKRYTVQEDVFTN